MLLIRSACLSGTALAQITWYQAWEVFALASGRVITEGFTYGFFISVPQLHRGFETASARRCCLNTSVCGRCFALLCAFVAQFSESAPTLVLFGFGRVGIFFALEPEGKARASRLRAHQSVKLFWSMVVQTEENTPYYLQRRGVATALHQRVGDAPERNSCR